MIDPRCITNQPLTYVSRSYMHAFFGGGGMQEALSHMCEAAKMLRNEVEQSR